MRTMWRVVSDPLVHAALRALVVTHKFVAESDSAQAALCKSTIEVQHVLNSSLKGINSMHSLTLAGCARRIAVCTWHSQLCKSSHATQWHAFFYALLTQRVPFG